MLRKDHRAQFKGTQRLAHLGLVLLTFACLFGSFSSPDVGIVLVIATGPVGLVLFFAGLSLQSHAQRRDPAGPFEQAD